jgi:hypothetical protein
VRKERVVRDRRPDLGAFRIGEAGRGHAHHLVGFAVDLDRLAHGGGVAAEPLAPQPVPEDRHFVAARLVLAVREPAPEDGTDPQHVEEAGAHLRALEPRGRAAAGEGHPSAVDGRQGLEVTGQAETGGLPQPAQGVKEVLAQSVHARARSEARAS